MKLLPFILKDTYLQVFMSSLFQVSRKTVMIRELKLLTEFSKKSAIRYPTHLHNIDLYRM